MKTSSFAINGNIVDVVKQRIYSGTVEIENGKIKNIIEKPVTETHYILPGFIDAHVHIESSMLIPSEFARLAVTHGTVATASDPHEIANVLGIDGVKFMIENGKKVPFKFYFGAPSCVPATPFESSGASLGVSETEELLKMDDIYYLAEMMNFPGVLFNNEDVISKLALAKKYNKPVDGHAPGLKGDDARKYTEAGITTDHECFTMEEAIDKINFGMKILIREGSAAKNFEDLIGLMKNYSDKIMFCSDDKHPDELAKNHMNAIAARAVAKGYDALSVITALTLNPVKHYKLDVGLLQKNDDADFILVNDLKEFNVKSTYIKGNKVAENGTTLIKGIDEKPVNYFNCSAISKNDIRVDAKSDKIKVIEAIEGQLITKCIEVKANIVNNEIKSDIKNDILKLVVMNRYQPSKPAVAFIKGFGFKDGAIASTVAHDSHNIIAIGTNDDDLVNAINLVIKNKGGISAVNKNWEHILPLPVAGLMSDKDGFEIAKMYELIDNKAKELGTQLKSPFMTLSFMALLVIPELKLSDKGLFNGTKFSFTELF
ncbi:MAG TPA: adenine deaminase [Bacteroidales bacterium]|nr:adenine deaminase [Bacteroidales bacterium]HPS17308.1 adenine deaminase [Bacteroidales bacterium]